MPPSKKDLIHNLHELASEVPLKDASMLRHVASLIESSEIPTKSSHAEDLANAHWNYLKDVIELHYKTAFIHGYKHGQEDHFNTEVQYENTLLRDKVNLDLLTPKDPDYFP